jgi:hypothetical protein
MMGNLPDFKRRSAEQRAALGAAGAARLLDAGRCWELAPALAAGGSLLFPHASIEVCGHQIAAAVHAVLEAGAHRVLVLGVLHALTDELAAARQRVAAGGDPAAEASWGIQGPDLVGREDWRDEFSLDHFGWLLAAECLRRGCAEPERLERYPFLAGGAPERLPGFAALAASAREAGTVIVATGDLCHHGRGYGDGPEAALAPEAGGLDLARRHIGEGLELLARGEHAAFQQHCVTAKSDARDVGQVLRALIGPCHWELLDLVADDMSEPYQAPAPTWVAGALVALSADR